MRSPRATRRRRCCAGTSGLCWSGTGKRHGVEADVIVLGDATLRAAWQLATHPLVSVVIPNKNRAHLLSKCLQGLTEDTAYPALEIIVVDNGSTDEDTLALDDAYRDLGVRIVAFDEPFNYSRACNVGAREAAGELLLFLNNDIEVIEPDWLTALVRQVTQDGVGVAGPLLLYPYREGGAPASHRMFTFSARTYSTSPRSRNGQFSDRRM